MLVDPLMEADKHYPSQGTEEIHFTPYNGCWMLVLILIFLPISLVCTIVLPVIGLVFMLGITLPLLILFIFLSTGFFVLQPNESMVLIFFGKYRGTTRKEGLHWCNPFFSKTKISLRLNNLNGEVLKVNDKVGNPIEIAAVVVWRVKYTARAVFDVLDYFNYVKVQYESAVRNLAMSFPYEKTGEYSISLRDGHADVTNYLMKEMQERLSKAGIDVEEAKIATLSYSSEIASVMLRRQQAEAVIGAREKIVNGAIKIIGSAITSLKEENIVDLNREERSHLVTSLLVVLCSESQVQPVLNTGN